MAIGRFDQPPCASSSTTTTISLWGWGGVGIHGAQLPITLCCVQHCLMALLTIYRVPGPVLILFSHTPHRVDPDQTVSASGQGGRGTNRGGAPNPQGHRGPIQVWIARRTVECEEAQSVPTHCFVTASGYTARQWQYLQKPRPVLSTAT